MRRPSDPVRRPRSATLRSSRWIVRPDAPPEEHPDHLTVEEPLEIRLRAGDEERVVAVTMRTPGSDAELALGFLYAEGMIRSRDEVAAVTVLDDPWAGPGEPSNVLAVELAAAVLPELSRLERHFFTSSACGVCGKAGISQLRLRGIANPGPGPRIEPEVLFGLPDALRRAQGVFEATGGLHAAALFDARGELLVAREDVGRHNAVDKILGWSLGEDLPPLTDRLLLVSGRASFEILQKALAASLPCVCAVSAPSSLAVDLAREFGVTLIGFLRDDRFNLYSGPERLAGPAVPTSTE